MHSLICLEALASLLFYPVAWVFMVRACIQRLFGSFIGGKAIVLPPDVWKLILRKVHCPYAVSETFLMVPTCSGM